MKASENDNWLDDALERAIGTEKKEANFESFKVRHGQAVEKLISRAGRDTATGSPNVWRMIMKSRMTKLAAAAVFLVAVGVVGTVVLEKSAAPAWAIEDTIRALEQVSSVKISGIISDGGKVTEFVMWATPDEDGTASDLLRFEGGGQTSVVTVSGKTYRYHPGTNKVYVHQDRSIVINPWLGSEFFNTVRKFTESWEVSYGRDEQTSRACIFATCVHPLEAKSWWFQFDAQTKLPVRFKQWVNSNFEGEPQFYAEQIEYNPQMTAGIFDFEIPEHVEVIEVVQEQPKYFDDPNCGMSAEGLTDEQACLQIVEDYWRAVIDGDWDYLARLRPIASAERWALKYKFNDSWPEEVIAIGEPLEIQGCNIGPVVVCTVRYSDGEIKDIQLIVKLRRIDGNRSCVIAGTYGGTKDFER